jgi:AbrB family looped-hinge helix DNA binding protein
VNAVTVKGQVTIPKPVRDALGIGPESLVDFVMDQDGRIVLRKAGVDHLPPHPFDHVVGSLGPGLTTDDVMALTRGEG